LRVIECFDLAEKRTTGVLDEVADRAAQVVGQGGTRPCGVGTIGNLACSHGVIEADLRVVRKRDAKEGKAPEKTGAVQSFATLTSSLFIRECCQTSRRVLVF